MAGQTERATGGINGIIATLLLLAVLVERIAYAPRPLRRLILWIMLRAEATAYSYVYWTARDCGMPLQHPGPSRQRDAADVEDALELGWWFRAVAMALRDIQRRIVFIQSTHKRLCFSSSIPQPVRAAVLSGSASAASASSARGPPGQG